ncbi:MAG: CPBP family intramembrane metalloprotease [Bacteroidetes bacterium]|nr:CPBP family intramembrane metalloprotease [Bacteroidota bacterium]
MKNILFYIRDYFFRVDKVLLFGSALFAALLIVCNYHFHIETHWLYSLPKGLPRFAGFFALYSVAFLIPWLLLLYRHRNKRRSGFPASASFRTFVVFLLAAPAVFALKVAFPPLAGILAGHIEAPWDKYYGIVFNLPMRLILIAIPLYGLLRMYPGQDSFWGLTTRNFRWQPYAIMLLCMIPLIGFASTQGDFLAAYPKVKQVAFIDPYVQHRAPYKLLYEIGYGLDFVSIELFFRGFLVFAFVRFFGADAIVPMAVFYCSIHFGKPLFECISSFFGGLLLGIVSYRTRSILGGFMVHVGIAWMMELGGWLGSAHIRA